MQTTTQRDNEDLENKRNILKIKKRNGVVEPINECIAPQIRWSLSSECLGAQLHAKSNLQLREEEGGVLHKAQRIQISLRGMAVSPTAHQVCSPSRRFTATKSSEASRCGEHS